MRKPTWRIIFLLPSRPAEAVERGERKSREEEGRGEKDEERKRHRASQHSFHEEERRKKHSGKKESEGKEEKRDDFLLDSVRVRPLMAQRKEGEKRDSGKRKRGSGVSHTSFKTAVAEVRKTKRV